ncbi:putative DNA-binding transcriptional regulator AlpA [Pseudoroseomonas cervicalis]|nr:putative DNA-binding transcriptional regulator AlpA [Pseudoroseomonas cervicalis]
MPDGSLPISLPPRFLSREQAAEYLGVSTGTFDAEVRAGTWPQPLRRGPSGRRLTWDRLALDAAADLACGVRRPQPGARAARNTWDDV